MSVCCIDSVGTFTGEIILPKSGLPGFDLLATTSEDQLHLIGRAAGRSSAGSCIRVGSSVGAL